MNLHCHLKSIVYVRVHSWFCTLYGFGQCVLTYTYHYIIIQSGFTALQILCVPPTHPPSLTLQLLIIYCHFSFAFSRISYSCTSTVFSLFRLISFTQRYTYLRFFHVCSWLDTLFLLITKCYSFIWMCHS
jgi:hypothetical protein